MERLLQRLHGETPRSRARVIPLAAKGFRPFFLLAACLAVAGVPLWILTLLGAVHPGAYFDATSWHAHEMVFGYSTAVIAGFLLTAVGNWTGRETVVGTPLLALSALWSLGRVALMWPALFPSWLPAAVDLAFLPTLIGVLARPLVAAKNKRNFVMLGMLTALSLANLVMHLDVLGVLPGWRRRGSLVGVDVIMLMILVVVGRTLPMFTRNGTGLTTIRSVALLDVLTVASMGLLVILDTVAPDIAFTAALSGLVGVLALARSAHWGARRAMRVPLLAILHVGYLWVPLGLGLRAVAALTGAIPASIATHALTVGAIGALTLGMMSRVALGHTGRVLAVPRPVVASFALVTVAALVRVLGPVLAPEQYLGSLVASGILWSASFGLFLASYAGILVSPRVDGKTG